MKIKISTENIMGLIRAVVVLAIFVIVLKTIESKKESNALVKKLYPFRFYIAFLAVFMFEFCL